MSALLPEGCRSLAECPWNLVDAILTGLSLAGFDELDEKDRPPKRIWLDGPKLKEHWSSVRRAKEEEMGVNGRRPIDSDGPVLENEAAKDLIVGD